MADKKLVIGGRRLWVRAGELRVALVVDENDEIVVRVFRPLRRQVILYHAQPPNSEVEVHAPKEVPHDTLFGPSSKPHHRMKHRSLLSLGG